MRSHHDRGDVGRRDAAPRGAEAVHEAFEQVASWFSDCTDYDIDLIAAGASGDLA